MNEALLLLATAAQQFYRTSGFGESSLKSETASLRSAIASALQAKNWAFPIYYYYAGAAAMNEGDFPWGEGKSVCGILIYYRKNE